MAWLGGGCATATGVNNKATPPAMTAPPPASSSAAPEPHPAASSATLPASSSPALPPEDTALSTSKAQFNDALKKLQEGASAKKEGTECQQSYEAARKLLDSEELSADQESASAGLTLHRLGANCAAFSENCPMAWKIFHEGYPKESLANIKEESQRTTFLQMSFGSEVPRCKGKAH